ncbi:MAG: hypothetical protein IMW98_07695 [Firmicutes bacterium]|nr:hypothetical protein [Bacillota bacterium]
MTPEGMLHRDVTRAGRWLAMMLILALLPWMFIQSSWSFPRYPVREPVPVDVPVEEPAPAAEPVPQGYPVPLTWTPVPLAVLWDWVQRNYPDTVLTQADVATIDAVARQWNVSTELLFGILVAEQGFLSVSRVGLQHALEFHENPFDYGVYPGSPFPFAIGVEKSAEGAAGIIARAIEGYPAGDWDLATWQSFWASLSGVYVHGDVHSPSETWVRNVTVTMSGVWQVVQEHADEVAQSIESSSPSLFHDLSQSVTGLYKSLGVFHSWLEEHLSVLSQVPVIGPIASSIAVAVILGLAYIIITAAAAASLAAA